MRIWAFKLNQSCSGVIRRLMKDSAKRGKLLCFIIQKDIDYDVLLHFEQVYPPMIDYNTSYLVFCDRLNLPVLFIGFKQSLNVSLEHVNGSQLEGTGRTICAIGVFLNCVLPTLRRLRDTTFRVYFHGMGHY